MRLSKITSATPVNTRKALPDLPIVGNQRKWNIIKVVLRTLCIALNIVIIAALIILHTGNLLPLVWFVYPTPAVALLWDVLELITIMMRGSVAKGIHPGYHVTVELLLFLSGIVVILLQVLTGLWWSYVPYQIYAGEGRGPTDVLMLVQFIFSDVLLFLRFIFFVRACVEVDRRKKDRRLQQLVFAIQKQGRNPEDIPLSTFRAVRGMDDHTALQALSFITQSTTTTTTTTPMTTMTKTTPQISRTSAEEREFAYKYNFSIATVPELLQSGIHPEDARNQKVLIGAFPR